MAFRFWRVVKKAIMWTSAGFVDKINKRRGCTDI